MRYKPPTVHAETSPPSVHVSLTHMNHKALLDTPKQGERVTSAPIVAPHQQPPLGKKRWNVGTGLFISSTNTLISSEPILECSFLKTPPSEYAMQYYLNQLVQVAILSHNTTHAHSHNAHTHTNTHTYIHTYTLIHIQQTHILLSKYNIGLQCGSGI